MTDIKVKCFFCGEPIHIDHFGGVCNINGKEAFFCDKITCLVQVQPVLEKSEVVIINNKIKKFTLKQN